MTATILLCEDQEPMRKLVRAALEGGDYSEATAWFGADRYLAKPFRPFELARVVEELLGRRR